MGIGTAFLMAFSLAVAPASPVPPPGAVAQVEDRAALLPYAGTYVDDQGAPIDVTLVDGALQLASGRARFRLVATGPGHFAAEGRALAIHFSGDELTIVEQGRVAAHAVRGAAPPPPIQPQGAGLGKWLDANVPALLARYRIPGAAIAYIDKGDIALTRVYGERRHGIAAGDDTLFNVASLTKPVAAEVLLRLAAAGRIDLDAKMAPLWVDPDIAGDPRAEQLTVRMALQHRTGLPNWRSQTANLLTFTSEPGARFSYSGEGYTYAAHYAERRTGKDFEALARDLVFAPSGMRSSFFTVQPGFADRIAYPHDGQGRELWPFLRLDFSAACCLYSTAGDYARFVTRVMHDEALSKAIADQRFAVPDQRAEMCTGDGMDAGVCPPRIGWGLGWMVLGFPGETVIVHTGVNDGERSVAFFVPEKDVGLVILTNGANGARLIRDVTAAAYDNPGYRRITEWLAR